MKTIGYLRVSTDKQDTDNQKLSIVQHCEKNKITVDEWFSETVSGTKKAKDRLFGNVLDFCGKGDTIIVSELSRVSRSMFDMVEMLNICLQKGISVVSIKDNLTLDNTPQGKVMACLIGFFAEMERNRISERTKDGLRQKKAIAKESGVPMRTRGFGKCGKLNRHKDEINNMMSSGMLKYQIAEKLKVSRNTLNTYLNNSND